MSKSQAKEDLAAAIIELFAKFSNKIFNGSPILALTSVSDVLASTYAAFLYDIFCRLPDEKAKELKNACVEDFTTQLEKALEACLLKSNSEKEKEGKT